MKAEPVLIPMMSVHPDRICCYSEVNWIGNRPGKYDQETGEKVSGIKFDHLLNSKRKSEGKVSEQARRKISKALDYLLLLANNKQATGQLTGRKFTFKICFITLTLPSAQVHPDNEIKGKCLNQFIIELTKYYHVRNYLWRAEKQKNGAIHFHIITDKFIPWSEIRDRWNRIVNKLGYVDRYRNEMKEFHQNGFKVRADLLKKWDHKKQVKAWETGKKNDWNNPNSTDIHSVRKILDIKKYVSKYMTKNVDADKETGEIVDENEIVDGRIWGCNQSLSNVKGAQMIVDNETSDAMVKLREQSGCKSYHGDYFDVFFIDFRNLAKFGGELIANEFFRYLAETFNYHQQLELTG
jgi:hypothetical protein